MKVSRVFLLIVGVLLLATAASATPLTLELKPLAVSFPYPTGQITFDCDVLSGSEVYVHLVNLQPQSYTLVLEADPGERTVIGPMPVGSQGVFDFQFHMAECPLALYQQVLVLRGTQQTLFAALPR